jgi:hypothetical protein
MMMTTCLIFERASARSVAVDADDGAVLDVGVAVGGTGALVGWLRLGGLGAMGTAVCGADSEQANNVALTINKDKRRPFFLIPADLSYFSCLTIRPND